MGQQIFSKFVVSYYLAVSVSNFGMKVVARYINIYIYISFFFNYYFSLDESNVKDVAITFQCSASCLCTEIRMDDDSGKSTSLLTW